MRNMQASLDDKLWAIINHHTDDKDRVAAIKQAFADDHWIKVRGMEGKSFGNDFKVMAGSNIMTGQEWYDRFVSNMKPIAPYPQEQFKGAELYHQIEIDRAAKRAAGLDA